MPFGSTIRLISISFIIFMGMGIIVLIYFGGRAMESSILIMDDCLAIDPTCFDNDDCLHGICLLGSCVCELEWEGVDCNTTRFICTTNSSNEEEICNHGSCYLGICICDIGYQGIYCNETADMCISSNDSQIACVDDDDCNDHGTCWFGKCVCEDGWYGEFCVYHSCPNVTEYNNCTVDTDCIYGTTDSGDCYYGRCFCLPNYAGVNCELERRDLSYCINDAVCLNGGLCYLNDHGTGECFCPSTTTGNLCET